MLDIINYYKIKKMKIYITSQINNYWVLNKNYFSMQDINKFCNYFLPFIENPSIIENNSADICIYDIFETNIPANSKINILLCIENCPLRNYYKHYNKFGNFGDNNIKLYIYNHIDKCVITNNFLAIPLIYLQIHYFKNYYNSILPNNLMSFTNKKFCLIATNPNSDMKNIPKKELFNFLTNIHKCDYLSDFKNIIGDKSCYHSNELLNLFNQYKFVFVCENSLNDGYITEKIFNCYFARVIPLYFGSLKIEYYFNKNTFINLNSLNYEEIKKTILEINDNEEKYNQYISPSNNIINTEYDDEDFLIKTSQFINEKLK